jgi:hypothetical protein
MCGVVPKTMWSKTNPADQNNMCNWSMRSLLIEDGNRLILIDAGIGDKQSEKFFSHYYLFGEDSLQGNLKALGFSTDDITDVFLTHLHFDHCGGSVNWNHDKTGYEVAFKNANFWTNKNHWEWATQPNSREKASFLNENILPMQQSGQLKFINRTEGDFLTTSELDLDISTIKSDVFSFLDRNKATYDIIFADPPYDLSQENFEILEKAHADYQKMLSDHDVTDKSLVQSINQPALNSFWLVYSLAPFALLGKLIWWMPGRISIWIANKTVTRIDFYTSVLSGIMGVLGILWWIFLISISWAYLGNLVLPLTLILPLLCYLYMQWEERKTDFFALQRINKMKNNHPRKIIEMIEQRSKIMN